MKIETFKNWKIINESMRIGTRSLEVETLQNDLINMGYSLPRYGADGKYGQETKMAVMALQDDLIKQGQSLPRYGADGIYGKETKDALAKSKISKSKTRGVYPTSHMAPGTTDNNKVIVKDASLKNAGAGAVKGLKAALKGKDLATTPKANAGTSDDVTSKSEVKPKKKSKLPNHVQSYIDKYGPQAVKASQQTFAETGVLLYPSVMLAQSALESGWGKSGLTKKANNFFGIKTRSSKNHPWNGESYTARTREVFNGKETYINEPFRKYDNAEDSFYDRNMFLQVNSRYKKNGVFSANSPIQQIEAIKKAGYATAPDYVEKISNILYRNGMDKLDNMVKSSNA